MKIIVDKRWADGTPMTWEESAVGTHVPLPLDAIAVSDAVVEAAAKGMHEVRGDTRSWDEIHPHERIWCLTDARAAIAALAQALGEEG
jgi:hypothetical protein